MACFDGVNFIIGPASGDLIAGTHTITVEADGNVMTCTFDYPLVSLPGGGSEPIECQNGLSVTIAPLQSCVEEKSKESTSYTCTPIPNSNQERIFFRGTPNQISVAQSVDGSLILNQTITPTYIASEPNGQGCGICRQAKVEWTLP
jgi:hypothetical protein